LLTADAIPALRPGAADRAMIIVAFSQPMGSGLPSAKASPQNHRMRNPDKWSPMDPGGPSGPEEPNARRAALVGLVLVLLLVAGGLLLTRVLRGMAQTQDCALSGRSNCT